MGSDRQTIASGGDEIEGSGRSVQATSEGGDPLAAHELSDPLRDPLQASTIQASLAGGRGRPAGGHAVQMAAGDEHTITFGVGGLTHPQLVSTDVEQIQEVGRRFEEQLCLQFARMGPGNIPVAFLDSIYDMTALLPQHPPDLPLLVETTVQVTEGEGDGEWAIRVLGMSARINPAGVADASPGVGQDPDDVRQAEAGRGAAISAGIGLARLIIMAPFAGMAPVLGTLMASGQMLYALGRMRTEYLRYATRTGFWHSFAFHPAQGANPSLAFMDGNAQADPDGVQERYQLGYAEGGRLHQSGYDQLWAYMLRTMRQGTPEQRQAAEALDAPAQRQTRDEVIATVLRRQYPGDDDRRVLMNEVGAG